MGADVRIGLLVCGLLLVVFPSVAPAQESGATVVLRGTLTDNTYVAGGTIDVLGDLERDLVAAGGTIHVGRLVKGDVLALIVLALVGLIPVAGGIVALLSLVAGLGAWSRQAFRHWSGALG